MGCVWAVLFAGGSLYLATDVDPLFFLLPILEGLSTFMQPDQLLSAATGDAQSLRACLSGVDLATICDVNGAVTDIA